jgi:hypothetical protein
MNKRYIIRHCQDKNKSSYYEAHYSAGGESIGRLFTINDYGKFLQFCALLVESGYNYIENEEEY